MEKLAAALGTTTSSPGFLFFPSYPGNEFEGTKAEYH